MRYARIITALYADYSRQFLAHKCLFGSIGSVLCKINVLHSDRIFTYV